MEGLAGVVGAAGLGLGGLSDLAGTIFSVLGLGEQSKESKLAQQQWEAMRDPVGRTYKSMFYVPSYTGIKTPYGTWGDAETYSWAPSQAMQNLYSSYLSRTYGLPEAIARAQSTQALQPIQMGKLPSSLVNPVGISNYINQQQGSTASALANAQLASTVPAINRQLDYLKNAAQLSAFNLYRAQYLPQLVG